MLRLYTTRAATDRTLWARVSARERVESGRRERERGAFNVYEIKFLPLAKCVRVDCVARTECFCRGQWWRSRAHVRAFASVNVHFNYGWKNEIAAHTQLNWVEHARTRTCFRVDKCFAIWLPFACINQLNCKHQQKRTEKLVGMSDIHRTVLAAGKQQ